MTLKIFKGDLYLLQLMKLIIRIFQYSFLYNISDKYLPEASDPCQATIGKMECFHHWNTTWLLTAISLCLHSHNCNRVTHFRDQVPPDKGHSVIEFAHKIWLENRKKLLQNSVLWSHITKDAIWVIFISQLWRPYFYSFSAPFLQLISENTGNISINFSYTKRLPFQLVIIDPIFIHRQVFYDEIS